MFAPIDHLLVSGPLTDATIDAIRARHGGGRRRDRGWRKDHEISVGDRLAGGS